MQRREFFKKALLGDRVFIPTIDAVPAVEEGLEPFESSPSSPWNRHRAAHLLRRTRLGAPSREEIDFFASLSPDEAVERLFNLKPPPVPPLWTFKPLAFTLFPFVALSRDIQLIQWWFSQAEADSTIRENMVYFWSNHFVVQLEKVLDPMLLYQQNSLFRKFATGNCKTLTKEIGKDPAMLRYLDGIQNTKDNLNENYARELQELFTIGLGNYTQEDVSEAARAYTGWRINPCNWNPNPSSLDQKRFDSGMKTFYGKTGNWDAGDIVDIIFQQEETALFLARKLYRHFVYHQTDEQIVAELAHLLQSHDYEIEPVLKTLLKSAHFMHESFIGADIKSPLDLLLGAIRQFGATRLNYLALGDLLQRLGQLPFNPPNVAGWKEHRNWITTTTLPLRQIFVSYVLTGETNWMRIDTTAFIKRYPNADDPEQLVHDIVNDLLPLPLSSEVEETLVDILRNTTTAPPWPPEQIAKLISVITQMPEYQLK